MTRLSSLTTLLLLGGLVAIVGCTGADVSSPFDIIEKKDGSIVFPTGDTTDVMDTASKDTIPVDVLTDAPTDMVSDLEVTADVAPDGGQTGWCEESGGFGCDCESNDQCKSGFCVSSADGKVCSMLCYDDCPDGWTCEELQMSGGDTQYMCVPSGALLCRPCDGNDECVDAAGEGGVCITYGAEGFFCGLDCQDDSACPDGYSCQDAESIVGLAVKQCKADTGTCACSQLSIDEGASTTCYVDNEYGACEGTRGCNADGLSACDAATPAPEACNGVDDDCDGLVDDGLDDPDMSDCLTVGVCATGLQVSCDMGDWDCDYSLVPSFEPSVESSCDGLDNDCDGETDEGDLDPPDTACPDEGVCAGVAVAVCADGDWTCDLSAVGSYEEQEVTCDGLDNDCDGVTDTDIPTTTCTIDNAYGSCPGIQICTDGVAECQGKPASPEVCNGVDDDCNGVTDDDFVDSDSDGTMDCIDQDDDNDGILDDGDGSGTEGDAPCASGVTEGCDDNCPTVANDDQADGDGDGQGDACDDDTDNDGDPNDTDCAPEDPAIFTGQTEACDGVDNDCDDLTDEDFDDTDADGTADCLDDDDDDDGILDDGDGSGTVGDAPCVAGATTGCDDNCPLTANADQLDSDGDGIGDACESDTDGDGDPDLTDCAPNDPTRYHGAPELCNGIVDNCGEQLPANEDDKDDDGMMPCAGDCDDLDDTVYDGAVEQCDGIDNDCDGVVPLDEANSDKDGYRVCEGDCDDADATTYPGATELCDAKDNDCDGQVPGEELDDDGDGYAECEGDCDDDDAARYPGNSEVCDGKDNDCASGVPADETDDDGDGLAECEGDCNDGDGTVYPGATERCNGKDDNCTGGIDECTANPDCEVYHKDSDGDGYGHATDTSTLCSASGTYTIQAGTLNYNTDCNDGNSNVHPGATEDCNSIDEDCDGSTDDGPQDSYESNNYWGGSENIGTYADDSDHDQTFPLISADINPSGDTDYFYVNATESLSDWCITDSGDEPMKCSATLTSEPTGKNYQVCVCWSGSSECSQAGWVCGTTSASVNKPMNCGGEDSGDCDVRVTSLSGWGCADYTLSVRVYE